MVSSVKGNRLSVSGAATRRRMGARQHPCTLIRNRGSMMKIVVLATLASFAMLSVASAADLPRRQPPPVAAAPVGKYPVGKYPVGKYPVGKYPQPVVTKG